MDEVLAVVASRLVAHLVLLIDPNVQNVGVGTVARVPFCQETLRSTRLGELAAAVTDELEEWRRGAETSRSFREPWVPGIAASPTSTLWVGKGGLAS